MEPFIEFTSGFSALDPDDYSRAIMLIWKVLELQATKLRDEVIKDPHDDLLAQDAMDSARMLLAFGEMISAGNRMTTTVLEKMRDDALYDPNMENREYILEETSMLLGLDDPLKTKKPSGESN